MRCGKRFYSKNVYLANKVFFKTTTLCSFLSSQRILQALSKASTLFLVKKTNQITMQLSKDIEWHANKAQEAQQKLTVWSFSNKWNLKSKLRKFKKIWLKSSSNPSRSSNLGKTTMSWIWMWIQSLKTGLMTGRQEEI